MSQEIIEILAKLIREFETEIKAVSMTLWTILAGFVARYRILRILYGLFKILKFWKKRFPINAKGGEMKKELEGKIGNLGNYSVDVTPDAQVIIEASLGKTEGALAASAGLKLELGLATLIRAYVAKTPGMTDDMVAEWVLKLVKENA